MQSILEKETTTEIVITPKGLLEHWQDHRALTRKVIEAFPQQELFNYSMGGMRTFAQMVFEMLDMAVPGVSGVVTGQWKGMDELSHVNGTEKPNTKEDLLLQWDAATEEMNRLWCRIPPGRFAEKDVAFGQYEGTIISFILYFIDNEIHHRGQGYVYLRTLGIQPPPFWERS